MFWTIDRFQKFYDHGILFHPSQFIFPTCSSILRPLGFILFLPFCFEMLVCLHSLLILILLLLLLMHFWMIASKSKDTLFLLVIDECHYGINRGGQLSSILDSELCNLPNVCLLFVSATPENLFTACSRIPEIYRFDRTNSFPFYLQIGFGGPPSVDFRSKDWKNCIRDLNADPIQRNKFFSAFPFYGSFFFPDQGNLCRISRFY